MPFYEYECSHCKYAAEVLQKISDAPLKKCPSCGRSRFQRLVSAPVFRLKGSGWYETDFKSEKENKRNLAGAEREEAKKEPAAEAKPPEAAKPAAEAAPAGKAAKEARASEPARAARRGAAAPRAGTKRSAPRRAPARARGRRRGG